MFIAAEYSPTGVDECSEIVGIGVRSGGEVEELKAGETIYVNIVIFHKIKNAPSLPEVIRDIPVSSGIFAYTGFVYL